MPRSGRIGWMLIIGLIVLVVAGGVHAQSSTTNPYRATFGWEQLPEGRVMGTVSGVFPDPDGRHLWILDRCGANQCAGTDLDPIMKFDVEGNLVDSFGAGLFAFPHGFFLDHEGFLWVTEGGSHGDARATLGETMGIGHQVLKLNQQGEVVMRLGEAGVWGDDEAHFNGPSGVVVSPGGDIWVSDGHRGGNNRIVKFSGDGTFLLAIGGGVGSESKEAAGLQRPPRHQDGLRGAGLRGRPPATAAFRCSTPTATCSTSGPTTASRAGCSSTGTTSCTPATGCPAWSAAAPPTTGAATSAGRRGVRIGDLKTEQAWVTHFIPQHDEDVGAGIEFLGVDFDGNIYAGEVSRRRLVRYVLHRPSELMKR